MSQALQSHQKLFIKKINRSHANALKEVLVSQLFKLFCQQHVLPLCCVHGVVRSDFYFLPLYNFPPFCEHTWAWYPLMLSACPRLCRIVPCAFANLYLLFCSSEFFFSFSPVLFRICFTKCPPWFVIPSIFAACDYWLDCCWRTLTFELRWLLVGPSL